MRPDHIHFEMGWAQKWAQWPIFGDFQVVPNCSKLLDLNGGRGRNRTYNLSVKSRMLCQLSYASMGWKKALDEPSWVAAEGKNPLRTLKNIP